MLSSLNFHFVRTLVRASTYLNPLFALSQLTSQIFVHRLILSELFRRRISVLGEETNADEENPRSNDRNLGEFQLLFEETNFVQMILKRRRCESRRENASIARSLRFDPSFDRILRLDFQVCFDTLVNLVVETNGEKEHVDAANCFSSTSNCSSVRCN